MKTPVGTTLLLLALATRALAQPSPMPPLSPELAALQPASTLPADLSGAVKIQSFADVPKPVLTRVSPDTFGVETFGKNDKSYAVEAIIPLNKAVKKGDVGLARFALRALSARQETGEAFVVCSVQQTSAPFTKSVTVQVTSGPEWTPYVVPFTVAQDAAAGEIGLYFAFGNLQQKVEIKGAQVLNFGSSIPQDKLPATRFSYAGREAGAAWRQKALARIEELRTAPLQMVVVDAAGKPIEGAQVEAKQIQSAFAWGTAVESELITAQTPASDTYRAKTAELFDTVTIGNGLKWQRWMGADRRATTLKAMDWIEDRGLRLRGHTMVWPGWKFSPLRLQTLPDPAVDLPRQIQARIEDITTATKDRIWAWDVVNEPIHEADFYKHIPVEQTAEWFKQARRLDPKAQLFVNEYAMLNNAASPDFIAKYLEFVKMLQRNGAPVDGIGVQGHIGGQVRNPVSVLSDLDLLQTSGLPVHITEFDINTRDEELQADYTRDFLIACYSHPAVTAFIQWGFWQSDHWKPDAAMYRADWSEKPNAKVWRDLVMNQWRTKLVASTDAKGQMSGRGHLGTYRITVSKGGKVLEHHAQLTKERGLITLTLQ